MKVVLPSGEEIEAELADSLLEKFLGMRFRSSGKMLFDFGKETGARIDMLFVQESLYLYFLNGDKEVIETQRARPWSLNPLSWRFYRPGSLYCYLLESFENLELEEGESLEFEI